MTDFTPPRCPNRACPRHRDPGSRFCQRRGTYLPKCRTVPIQRYRCKTCRKGFSYQTFRGDYRDHRPACNRMAFLLLASGIGLRQCGRLLDLDVHAVQAKFRKLARLLRRLNRNLLTQLPHDGTYLLDELETIEGSSICPVTVPVLIEKHSKLVVATGAASIRRVAKRGSRRQRWLQRHEQKHGRRRDHGRHCVKRVLRRWQQLLAGRKATLITDQKSLYASLCQRLFGEQVTHRQHSSRLPRTTFNPLFGINHTEAMLRDNCGRLRRKTWLCSKKARYLRLQLELFAAYRNWLRPRTNEDAAERTPGVVLGLIDRQLEATEMLAWRQDWGELTIHPASALGQETLRHWAA
jgi:transposase-like protein